MQARTSARMLIPCWYPPAAFTIAMPGITSAAFTIAMISMITDGWILQTCLMLTVKQLQALACLGHPFLGADVTAAILSAASSLRHCRGSIFVRDWKGFKQRSGAGKPHGQFTGTSTEFDSWATTCTHK